MISILMGRNIDEPEANKVVDRVFQRCYNDMEPFGRRIRGYLDEEMSLKEGLIYGYTPAKVEKAAKKPENMKP